MRFLVRFQLTLLLVVAGGLALLLGLRGYTSLARQVRHPAFGIFFSLHRDSVPAALTPARYYALQLLLGAVLLLALAGLGWLVRRAAPRPVASAGHQLPLARRWWAELLRSVRQLSGPERAVAVASLGVVLAVRLYYAGYYPLSLDEIASYDYFVVPGAAVTASYYSFPNNHILANLLVGLVHTVLPGASPAVVLRLLPTLLGVLTLPLVYALMLRYLRFGVATLGLGLYWLSPLGVYYAVAGRGYAWALAAALAGLLATAELLRPDPPRRATRQLAWAVFCLSAVVGLYAVPTHLYALLGLGVALLVGFSRRPRRARRLLLAHLAVATLGIVVIAGVLYAPVGAVSGWAALLANPYVARHPWAEFSQGIGPFLVGTATELLGQRGLSAAAYCLVLGLAPVALCWGRLPEPTRRLGWLLWLQLGLWLPIVLAQRVNPPARTLLLVLLAFFLLTVLLGQAVWARWVEENQATWLGGAKLRPLGLVLVLGAYGGYRLHREQAIIRQLTQQQWQLQQAYGWLQSQAPRRVWVEQRAFALYWHHYALRAGQRPLPLVVPDDAPGAGPGPVGEVEALKPGQFPAAAQRPARYSSQQVLIIPVSPTQPLIPE